jgi:hypothetical protein
MTFKNQWNTLKENWIIALIVLLVLLVPMFSGTTGSFSKGFAGPSGLMMESAMVARDSMVYNEGFASEIEERKITKSGSISSEVERGEFKEGELKLKSLISSTDSFLINENVNRYGEGRDSYYYGTYQIKVETIKYDLMLKAIKEIGEVQSFNENSKDITGSYYDIKTELNAEKEKLARFEQMYDEVKDISDKIELSEKIFDQERRVKYLEEAMSNKDLQVEYSTIYVTLKEEQSGYVGMAVVKFSELVRNIVNSFNNILSLLFWAVPWVILVLLGWFIVKKVRK